MQNKTSEANSSVNKDEDCRPRTKKARLLSQNSSAVSSCRLQCIPTTIDGTGRLEKHSSARWLIDNYSDCVSAKIPRTLYHDENDSVEKKTKIGQDIDKLRRLLNIHGLRTTKISSPREAVSIYKDSCRIALTEGDGDDRFREGKEFLLVMFGIHPRQEDIERDYDTLIKNAYCIVLFCQKLRQEYYKLLGSSTSKSHMHHDPETNGSKDAQKLFRQIEQTLRFANEFKDNNNCGVSSRYAEDQVNTLIQFAVNIKGKSVHRKEEWRKEYQRICVSNSTISNAHIFLLQSTHEMCIKDIYFKYNPQEPKYERITIYLYDPAIDYGRRSAFFLFLPGLHTIVNRGPNELVSKMIDLFWTSVIRNGYYPTTKIRQGLESHLRHFFLSGFIATNTTNANKNNLLLPLKANFIPTAPLSIYLYGKAGSGKSSLAKILPTALQSTLEKSADPDCTTRFVKQNLNKCMKTLELEFELRPNNNDMSIMSIIQGRRMAMSQSKPGLVVLNLEEMPICSSQNNPNQLSVARLIAQRFGGRKGNYKQDQSNNCLAIGNKPTPRNSDKRSIGRDCSLVTIITSNYPLEEDSKIALQQLELYQSLQPIQIHAITGSDRCQFAESYLRQCLIDSLGEKSLEVSKENIRLDISFRDGDTRPLVRQLRMYVYYLRKMLISSIAQKKAFITIKNLNVSQLQSNCSLTVDIEVDGKSVLRTQQQLKIGSFRNWYPSGTFIFDSKTTLAIQKLNKSMDDNKIAELSVILEFWFSATLAPAVILSRNKNAIKHLMDAISCIGDEVHCIRNVNSETYKMIKSLYDPRETPNLRDDILKFGPGALVAIELNCPTEDSQLCIREMIEDSPSMTAFSSTKSALYKSGLLFAIHVEGETTPEILSRVSILI